MTFNDLPIKPEYRSPKDNIIQDFYIPVLTNAVSYKRSVGFFSSSALVQISKGICELAKKGGQIEIVASPYLSKKDEEAIRTGYENRAKIIENALLKSLKEETDYFDEQRLNLLAHLIEKGVLNIKIAFTDNGNSVGMYHEKLGIIEDAEGNKIAFSGSMNESENAMLNNYETIDVFCSWKEESEKSRVIEKQKAFDKIWNNYDEKLKVKTFTSIEEEILKKYLQTEPNYNLDKIQFTKNKTEYEIKVEKSQEVKEMEEVYGETEVLEVDKEEGEVNFENENLEKTFFNFGEKIKPFAHQNAAVENFRKNNYQSLFAMATGTGKTLTSLFAANELFKNVDYNSIIIIVPLKDLVDQWQKDIKLYFDGTIIPVRSGIEWKEKITDLNISRQLKNHLKNQNQNNSDEKLVIITTYESFCQNSEKILNSLEQDKTLIIADEVHKFGAESYSKKLPEKIKYRIGLSATPKRPYDEEGTKAIFDYFCPSENPFEFTIKQAIEANMLCHYEYHPILVTLTDSEMDCYKELSEKISKISIILKSSKKVNKKDSDDLEKLCKERHRIIERAENKKELFLETMSKEIQKYKDKTLVFCPDGKDENENDFLEVYKTSLWNKLIEKGKIVVMKEYVQGTKREVIEKFAAGAIDILFSKQRLNEGIDIKPTKRAFFIASSTSEREFIQRRGRVLRKSPETNKKIAEIFDFIVVPAENNSEYAKKIINDELKRAMDFAATADNYSEIEKILKKYL